MFQVVSPSTEEKAKYIYGSTDLLNSSVELAEEVSNNFVADNFILMIM